MKSPLLKWVLALPAAAKSIARGASDAEILSPLASETALRAALRRARMSVCGALCARVSGRGSRALWQPTPCAHARRVTFRLKNRHQGTLAGEYFGIAYRIQSL